jgi:two-component system KDP operon response regulator KdpE
MTPGLRQVHMAAAYRAWRPRGGFDDREGLRGLPAADGCGEADRRPANASFSAAVPSPIVAPEQIEGVASRTRVADKPTILIVEDDPQMVRVIAASLETEGYRVCSADTGERGVAEVRTCNPDLVLLDLGLPDIDGLSVVPQIRAHSRASIIVVSAREQEMDKVKALDAGANDYLTKPFSALELLARIRVGLRGRAHAGDTAERVVTFGDYRLDLPRRRLSRGDRLIRLSPTELKLLATLARHADEVVTTHTLLKETWGSSYRTRDGYIRVYMHALRRKIENEPARPEYLITESGLGYRLRTSTD